MKKPSIVIEVRDGAVTGVFTNNDIQVILVDHDEEDGTASAEIVPEPVDEMSALTKRWAVDALERPQI